MSTTPPALVDDALAIHRELGFPLGEAYSWWMLGRIALARGESASALECLDEALGIYRRIRYRGYEVGAMLDIVRAPNRRRSRSRCEDYGSGP